MNNCVLVGRLTKAPDIRTTRTGKSVATFTIAVPRAFKRDETDFLNIVAWGAIADNCGKYLAKGSQVAVHGSIQVRSYETDAGERRYITEINANTVEFLGKVKEHKLEDDPDIILDDTGLYDEELPF